MAELRPVYAPRPPDSKTGALRDSALNLPEEVLSEQIQRLSLFGLFGALLWSIGLVFEVLVQPRALGIPTNWRGTGIEVVGIALALVFWIYTRRTSAAASTKADVGLAFMLTNAALLALYATWTIPPPRATQITHISWCTILVLIYAMVAPCGPRRILIVSLIAASFDAIAFGTASALGVTNASLSEIAILVWPNYACAVIAALPSRVLHRLGRQIYEAQALGSYHLVEKLGHGGMGEVWRAEHQLLARNAAVKVVRPEILGARTETEAQSLLRRFEREAQATASLRSPHTIQVFDFGTARDGSFFYVMELLVGRDLESLVRNFGPMPAERAVYLLRQVCHSLADAHAHGLVHRDIKPANIYVCRMGLDYDFAKVLDFGLVKMKNAARDMETLATMEHTTSGTPAYMAPETILGDVEVDRRADVYALGCVAYFLLTGHLVFEAETPMKMFMQHLQAIPVPPSQRSELPIPSEVDAFVMACLEKDPNKRPQSARELFHMACDCCGPRAMWSNDQAESWWRVHLPELVHDPALTPAASRFSHVASV